MSSNRSKNQSDLDALEHLNPRDLARMVLNEREANAALAHFTKGVSGALDGSRATVADLKAILTLIESGKDARGYELSVDGMKSLARYALKGK